MGSWHNDGTDALCRALLSLDSMEECYAFLEDVCTVKEFLDMAQRLAVARMLDNGESYASISAETGASTATISRVSKCYEYGTGGYKTVLERCKADTQTERKQKTDD